MRKLIALMLIVLMIVAAYSYGVYHAIVDSEIYTVDVYDPDDPDASEWCGYDQMIVIVLDGNEYQHGMTQC